MTIVKMEVQLNGSTYVVVSFCDDCRTLLSIFGDCEKGIFLYCHFFFFSESNTITGSLSLITWELHSITEISLKETSIKRGYRYVKRRKYINFQYQYY